MLSKHEKKHYLEEYKHMKAILGSDSEVWKSLQHQFSVLNQRNQTIFQLGALAITVTGFSGHRIVAAGIYSGIPLVIGLCIILIALFTALYGVSRLRWISTFQTDDLPQSFIMILKMRDIKTRLFKVSLSILLAGLCFYVFAISNFLIQASHGMIKVY
ncbi:hypothetical protein [Desulfovulcanus sp.]